ncbi:MAG: hypothetical protein K0Q59_165 [Paenibacillus sp.]|jgi:membrane-bound metal-dependent hydrolase YbcI (DUF457 family)|nr:hypothetical protein [Paenibacillus sp.]
MFAGHFGLAAAVKAKTPELPLWSLMVGAQLLDVGFVPLWMTGIETMDESHGSGYGQLIIHADYTHSLVGALLLALIGGLLAGYWKGRRAGVIMGAVVFSHWLLDLVVHRSDMPLLPGNFGDLPLLGLGMWRYTGMSVAVEALLLIVGFALYARSALRVPAGGKRTFKQLGTTVFVALLLALTLISDVM